MNKKTIQFNSYDQGTMTTVENMYRRYEAIEMWTDDDIENFNNAISAVRLVASQHLVPSEYLLSFIELATLLEQLFFAEVTASAA